MNRYLAKEMKGFDVDASLIDKAEANLEKSIVDLEKSLKEDKRDSRGGGGQSVTLEAQLQALRNCSFECMNILWADLECASVDTVLCLSVTKWVHMCHGDSGLEQLFLTFKNVLKPGGILVLEPQPWKS